MRHRAKQIYLYLDFWLMGGHWYPTVLTQRILWVCNRREGHKNGWRMSTDAYTKIWLFFLSWTVRYGREGRESKWGRGVGLSPAFFKPSMPERMIIQVRDAPGTVIFNATVLVIPPYHHGRKTSLLEAGSLRHRDQLASAISRISAWTPSFSMSIISCTLGWSRWNP